MWPWAWDEAEPEPMARGLSEPAKGGAYPLSRPFCPSFLPMSPTITPGMGRRVFGSRICTEHSTRRPC